jgi:type IV conjugative transfer system lipoprotein TraV
MDFERVRRVQTHEKRNPKKMSSKLAILASVCTLLLLQGCASQMNPVGEVKFDCNRRQDAKSPYCRSFRSVDASTTGEIPQSRFDKEFNMEELDRLIGISPDEDTKTESSATGKKPRPVILPHQIRQEPPLSGAPVREGPVVQRVWVKRFVDGNDVLTENTVVYKEIRGNRWAGFEGQGTSLIGDQRTYPRRPIETTPPAPNNTNVQDAQRPQSAPPTEFNQPGSNSEPSEAAFDPAVSGSQTMPK